MSLHNVKQLFSDLSRLRKGIRACGFFQGKGTIDNVFSLEKNGEHYLLMPSPTFGYEHPKSGIPSLCNRVLDYIVSTEHPNQVLVGLHSNRSDRTVEPLLNVNRVIGHSTLAYEYNPRYNLSLEQAVLYAGELLFDEDKLLRWSNWSGHYRPERRRRHDQLTPNVKRLLPERLFVSGGTFEDSVFLNSVLKDSVLPMADEVSSDEEGFLSDVYQSTDSGSESDDGGSMVLIIAGERYFCKSHY